MRRDRDAHNQYQRDYRKQHSSGRPAGRPPIEDRREHVTLRIPASLRGMLERLLLEGIATKRYPWRTRSHQYQDLITRGLTTIKGDEEISGALQYHHAMEATNALRRSRLEAQAAFAQVQREITEMKAAGAVEQARSYYWNSLDNFQKMDPTMWRDWLLTTIKKTFKDLAEGPMPTVNLGDEEPEARPSTQRRRLARVIPHTKKD